MQTHVATTEPSAYMSLKNVPGRRPAPTTAVNATSSFVIGASALVGAPGMTFDEISSELALDEYTGRRDALPEHYAYRNEGCSLNPSCLTCPLARCRYDLTNGMQKVRQDDHRRRGVELRRLGWSASRVASEMGVSRRTVFRLSKP